MEFQYKKEVDKEKRKEQCRILLIQNPDKIPIIIEKDPNCKIEPMKKTRHFIKKDFSVIKFIDMIRKALKLEEGEALFLLVKGKYSISGEKTLADIYKNYKDKEDGFLYIVYTSMEFLG